MGKVSCALTIPPSLGAAVYVKAAYLLYQYLAIVSTRYVVEVCTILITQEPELWGSLSCRIIFCSCHVNGFVEIIVLDMST